MLDDEKVRKAMNAIVNWGLIFIGGFQLDFSKAFTGLAEGIGKSMAKSFGGEKEKVDLKEVKNQMNKEILKMITEMKKEVAAQMTPENLDQMKKLLTEEDCNKIINIIEKYDFGLPPLTEELSDEALVGYLYLSQKKNKNYEKMMDEFGKFNDEYQKSNEANTKKSSPKKN